MGCNSSKSAETAKPEEKTAGATPKQQNTSSEPGFGVTFLEAGGIEQAAYFTKKPLGIGFGNRMPLVVTNVLAGSHGEELGVRVGWDVVSINGTMLAGKNKDQAMKLLIAAADIIAGEALKVEEKKTMLPQCGDVLEISYGTVGSLTGTIACFKSVASKGDIASFYEEIACIDWGTEVNGKTFQWFSYNRKLSTLQDSTGTHDFKFVKNDREYEMASFMKLDKDAYAPHATAVENLIFAAMGGSAKDVDEYRKASFLQVSPMGAGGNDAVTLATIAVELLTDRKAYKDGNFLEMIGAACIYLQGTYDEWKAAKEDAQIGTKIVTRLSQVGSGAAAAVRSSLNMGGSKEPAKPAEKPKEDAKTEDEQI